MSGSSTIDYKKLGLATGKSWRLGHPGADAVARIGYLNMSLESFKIPGNAKAAFRAGFTSGVTAVDKERRKVR